MHLGLRIFPFLKHVFFLPSTYGIEFLYASYVLGMNNLHKSSLELQIFIS